MLIMQKEDVKMSTKKNESLSYINNGAVDFYCFFVRHDILFLSVENCSFGVWCLLIVGLLFAFCTSKIRRIKW